MQLPLAAAGFAGFDKVRMALRAVMGYTNLMTSRDSPSIIEDEPYEGIYHGRSQPVLGSDGHLPDRFDLAEILKARRKELGLSLAQVADITRVRQTYLEAFEQVAYDVLPPRAFAIGYVKAYAKALGLDEESLADMFKRESAEPAVRLHAPSGASLEDSKPNYRIYIIAAACLVATIAIWNVVQRRPLGHGEHTATAQLDSAPWRAAVPNIYDGLMQLTRSAPAPQNQDVPPPYVTPGLEEGFAAMMASERASAGAPVPVTEVLQARKAFNPQGPIYGVQPAQSRVTLQATRSVNLIIRDGAGNITFAHQLNAGEAYRLPSVDQQDMQIEVSDVRSVEVYHNGEYAGQMDPLSAADNKVLTTAGKLNLKAEQMASVLDARQAQSGQVAAVYRSTAAKPQAPVAEARTSEPIPYLPAVRATPTPAPVPQTPAASTPAETAPQANDAAPQ